jgi:hypothetical protein
VTLETAWNVQRFASLLLAVWIGGIVTVALAAPLAFRAVDSLMANQPDMLKTAIHKIGPVPMYEVLRLLAGEVNRLLFQVFGYIQLTVAAVVFVQVVFFSNLKRVGVFLSGGMLAISGVMGFFLIPQISQVGREIQASAAAKAAGEERFRALQLAFTSFEVGLAIVGALLLALLLQRSRLTSRASAERA